MTNRNLMIMAGCIALPLLVGAISGFATRAESGGEWYRNLTKPSFNPPSWVFAPVWTTLYILMGIGLYMVVTAPTSQERTLGLVLFGIQLALNAMWSIIFFRMHRVDVALGEIVVLWAAIAFMIWNWRGVAPVGALLQFPYLCWVSFATVLNGAIWWLNRGNH